MTVNSNLNSFLNKRVENYDTAKGIQNHEQIVYRIGLEYEEYEKKVKVEDKIETFANDPKAGEVKEIIIGAFDFESSESSEAIVNKLAGLKDHFISLKAIFLGDITYEESEISWIKQSDVSPLLAAYPALEHFQVRGGDGLSLGALNHENLKTLIVETGGLPTNIITEIDNSVLPKLERLELWLGDSGYGFDAGIEDLDTIISGEKFPSLKHLGLMDSEIQDEVAIAVTKSPVMKRLEVLDLSMGVLSDAGGAGLLTCPEVKQLKFLNLRHHYLSDEMMAQLKGLGININLDEQEDGDEDDRYVEVAE